MSIFSITAICYLLHNYSLGEADTVGLHILTYRYGLQSERSEVQNSNRNAIDIRQEGHPEFKVLRWSSTKSGSKASV